MPFNFGNPDFFNEQVLRHSLPGHRSQVHVLLHSTNGQDAVEAGTIACLEPFGIGKYSGFAVFRTSCVSPYTLPANHGASQPKKHMAILVSSTRWLFSFENYSQLVRQTSIGP
jgi:hypothetical protein